MNIETHRRRWLNTCIDETYLDQFVSNEIRSERKATAIDNSKMHLYTHGAFFFFFFIIFNFTVVQRYLVASCVPVRLCWTFYLRSSQQRMIIVLFRLLHSNSLSTRRQWTHTHSEKLKRIEIKNNHSVGHKCGKTKRWKFSAQNEDIFFTRVTVSCLSACVVRARALWIVEFSEWRRAKRRERERERPMERGEGRGEDDREKWNK